MHALNVERTSVLSVSFCPEPLHKTVLSVVIIEDQEQLAQHCWQQKSLSRMVL